MSADDLLRGLTEAVFLLLAAVTLRAAVRHPRRFSVDTALFFGATAALILTGAATPLLPRASGGLTAVTIASLLMALPYLLLRLVDDFAGFPTWAMAVAGGGLVISLALLAVFRAPLPGPATLFLTAYFLVVVAYATAGAIREARRSTGVTQRRLQAIAGGSFLLGLVIVAAGLQQAIPAFRPVWITLGALSGLATGIAYFFGFAPIATLRRAWQEPELRAFLADAARLPHLEDAGAIVRALEQGTAAALGVPSAAIGLWDEGAERLVFRGGGDSLHEIRSGEYLGGRAFALQMPIYSADATSDDPIHADRYRSAKAIAVLTAPITAGSHRLGVLIAYAAQPPVFAEDDLDLVQLLARQAAVIIDYVRLFEASRLRAEEIERLYEDAKRAQREREDLVREQAARAEAEAAVRARDEFLSIAAHELRTPVTGLRGFVQVLLRQLDRRGAVDPQRLGVALRTIDEQSTKLTSLIGQLLDVSRLSTATLQIRRRRVDVVPLVADALAGARLRTATHALTLDAPPRLLADIDPLRFEQVIANLIDNAIKYSPNGGAIDVATASHAGERFQVRVRDHGIGIPLDRREHLFDRFYQAHSDDYYSGMGLGLYITRQIVELHGGTIAATFPDAGGACFTVTLPTTAPAGAT